MILFVSHGCTTLPSGVRVAPLGVVVPTGGGGGVGVGVGATGGVVIPTGIVAPPVGCTGKALIAGLGADGVIGWFVGATGVGVVTHRT